MLVAKGFIIILLILFGFNLFERFSGRSPWLRLDSIVFQITGSEWLLFRFMWMQCSVVGR